LTPEDLTHDKTHDKTDEKGAVLIPRLTAHLRCYVPEPVDETWARLRHLGVRREQLRPADPGSARVRLAGRAGAARQPFRFRTWIAALAVIVDRDRGDLRRTRRLGAARFEQVVRREILRRGGQKPSRASCAGCSPRSVTRPA
jgi:hypothetical protein